jgi:hypothetical protein
MRFLLLHMLAGIFTGVRFRIHTLVLVATMAVLEAGWAAEAEGFALALAWVFAAEISLQIGYIAGIGIRCAIEYAHPDARYYLESTGAVRPQRFRGRLARKASRSTI